MKITITGKSGRWSVTHFGSTDDVNKLLQWLRDAKREPSQKRIMSKAKQIGLRPAGGVK